MVSCKSLNESIVNTTLSKLEEKYGMTFEVTAVGNRLNKYSGTLFLKDPDGICFSAETYIENDKVEDSYIRTKIGHKIQTDIFDALSGQGINACGRTLIASDDCTGETNVNISVDEFIEKYNADSVMMYIGVENKGLNDKSISALCKIFEEQSEKSGIRISTSLFLIPSENYAKMKKENGENPDINDTWFQKFAPVLQTHCGANNGKFYPSEGEIKAILIKE